MTMSINTNIASMAALASLNQTNSALNQTQNEISTGKSINSASDNPAIYTIAQSMNAQVAALAGVSSGLQFSAQVLNTASTNVSSISASLTSLQTTVAGYTTGEDINTINQSLTNGISAIDNNAQTATFQGVNLLSGNVGGGVNYTSVSASQNTNGDVFSQQGFNATTTGLGLQGLSMDMKGATINLTGATLTASSATASTLTLENMTAASATAATASNPSVTTSFTLDSSSTANSSTVPTTLNAAVVAALGTGTGISIGSSTGAISITGTATQTVIGDNTTYTGENGTTLTVGKDANGNMTYTVGNDLDQNGNAQTIKQFVDVAVSATDNTSMTTALMSAVKDAGFGISRAGDGTLTIAGGNLAATTGVSLKQGATSGATALTGTVTGSTSGTAVVQLAIGAASDKMNRIAAALGNATNAVTQLQTTNSNLSSALTSGVGALTDADLAAESAKLTSLQTKQQLAIQSLSIANSQSQTLLKLFQG